MPVRILSNVAVNSLRSVRHDPSPARVGDYFALRGAWDRKKVAVKVSGLRVSRDYYTKEVRYHQDVWLQNVGRIYRDGRWVKPTRSSPPVKTGITFIKEDGKLKALEPRYTGYVKVVPMYGGHRNAAAAFVPQRRALQVVTNKEVDPKQGWERTCPGCKERKYVPISLGVCWKCGEPKHLAS